MKAYCIYVQVQLDHGYESPFVEMSDSRGEPVQLLLDKDMVVAQLRQMERMRCQFPHVEYTVLEVDLPVGK